MLFYNVSNKEQIESRKEIAVKVAIPALQKCGFKKSPFLTSWFGKDDNRGYTFDLCRVAEGSQLQMITINITGGDRWIKFYLNIFRLTPHLEKLEQLEGLDGLHFYLVPNSLSKIKLRSDDYKGIPLFHMLFNKQHKIGLFFTRNGYENSLRKASKLIANDINNIDNFIKRWNEMYVPMTTNWEGVPLPQLI